MSLVLCAAALFIIAITFSTPVPDAWGFRGYDTILATTFSVVGALIASRTPRNPLGWLMCGVGLLTSVQALARQYSIYAFLSPPDSLPFGDVMAWFVNWTWVIDVGVISPMMLSLFPNGHPLSPRWRIVLWMAPLASLLPALGLAFMPGPLDQMQSVDNPFGIAALQSFRAVLNVGMLGIVTELAMSATSLVLRLRRAQGNERQQLKWLAYVGAVTACLFGINVAELIIWQTYHTAVLVIFGFAAIPGAIGIAMLRYRLYDIDLVINRTLVYVPMTAVLAGLYIAGIGVLKTVFTGLTGSGSDAALAFTTLLVVALLTPLKNSLQTFVDKRFKETPDPKKKLRALTEQIKGVVQVLSEEQIAQRLLKDASSAYDAEYAAVRLGPDGTPEHVYTQGPQGDPPQIVVLLEHDHKRLGELAMGPRRGGRPYAAEDKTALESCARTVAEALAVARSAGLRSQV